MPNGSFLKQSRHNIWGFEIWLRASPKSDHSFSVAFGEDDTNRSLPIGVTREILLNDVHIIYYHCCFVALFYQALRKATDSGLTQLVAFRYHLKHSLEWLAMVNIFCPRQSIEKAKVLLYMLFWSYQEKSYSFRLFGFLRQN